MSDPITPPTTPTQTNYGGGRLRPRLYFRERPLPSHGALAMDWMVDQLRAQALTPPARSSGLNFVELGDQDQTFDGIGGTLVSYRPSALMLDYVTQWLPTGVGGKVGWIFEFSAAALQWIEVDRIALTNTVETLTTELQASGINPATKVQKEHELEKAQETLAQLQAGGASYAQTIPQCLDSETNGVFWALQAANVPIRATSTFALPRGRGVSLMLKRLKAPPEQARYSYTIFIANDKGDRSTAYALRLGDNGNASEFFHFRSMKPYRRKALFAAWDALEGAKFLTPAERKQVLDWDEQEQDIRAAAKGHGGAGGGLSVEDSRTIDALKENAKQLKDNKKLTAAQEEEKATLERELFIEKRQFKLQENSNELLGKTVELTFHFLRAGYIVIQSSDASGSSKFVYENKRITGLLPAQYADSLPDGCTLTVESDGGPWQLAYGHPRYNRSGTILSQPFALPAGLSAGFDVNEVLFGYDGDDALPGCDIAVDLVRYVEKTTSSTRSPKPLRYQLKVELRGNSEYSPELYSAGFHLPAAAVLDLATPRYNSQSPGFSAGVSGNWIQDVVMQMGAGRSPEVAVHLALQNDAAVDPPLNVAALVGQVVIHDAKTGIDATAIQFAKCAAVPLQDLRGLNTQDGKFAPNVRRGAQAAYSLVSALEWLNREVEAPFTMAHYGFPNDVLRALFRDGGLPASLYSRIGVGNIGITAIPATAPGAYPPSKIAATATLIEVARDVVKRYCPGWNLIEDGQGIDLVKFVARDRPELAYDLPPVVAVSSKLCLRREFKLQQETRDVVTGVTVYGARDPLTGVRYSHTETLPKMYESGFENSVYWIGQKNHRTLEADENLTGVAACIRAAREYLHITPQTPNGLAPWVGDAVLDFDSTLRVGDLVRCFGVKMLIEDLDLGTLAAGEDAGKITAKLHLAEDRPLQRN